MFITNSLAATFSIFVTWFVINFWHKFINSCFKRTISRILNVFK